MRAKKNKRKKNPFATVMAICWTAILVCLTINLYNIINVDDDYYSDAEYTLDYVEKEKYAELYSRMSSNYGNGLDVEKYSEYKELLAISEYVEAAGQYKMYKDNGMTEYADYYKAKMEKAKEGFGKLDFADEEVNEMLGLTE